MSDKPQPGRSSLSELAGATTGFPDKLTLAGQRSVVVPDNANDNASGVAAREGERADHRCHRRFSGRRLGVAELFCRPSGAPRRGLRRGGASRSAAPQRIAEHPGDAKRGCRSFRSTAREPVQADHVYVIAPDRRLQMIDHEISAFAFDEPRGHRAPIDLVLSLAGRTARRWLCRHSKRRRIGRCARRPRREGGRRHHPGAGPERGRIRLDAAQRHRHRRRRFRHAGARSGQAAVRSDAQGKASLSAADIGNFDEDTAAQHSRPSARAHRP